MYSVIIFTAISLLIFFLGALFGNGLNSLAGEQRSRRHAQVQRQLIDEWRRLEAARLRSDDERRT